MSLTVYLQFIGRVLRPMQGKENGIILDPVGNLFIHGFPEMKRAWSLSGSVNEPEPGEINQAATMRICPFCGVANAAVNAVCHFCGAELDSEEAKRARRRKLPAIVDGELVAVESDGQAEEIRQRAERIKEERARQEEERNRKKQEAIETDDGTGAGLSKAERAAILRAGLLDEKRKLFREAVKNYL